MNVRGRLWLVYAVAGRESGQTMAEYVFILGLVTLVSIGAVTSLGESVTGLLGPIVKAVAP
jgi:Flp pilus assembly pilin Flp